MSKCLVLFVEGDTEVEFYKQVVANARKLHPAGRFDTNIEYRNVRGVGGFKSIALRKFTKEIKPKYGDDCEFTIVLCSDTDVFDFAPKPPIKWDEVKKDLGNKFAQIVYEGKWFTPLCEALRAFVKSTQKYVTGEVKFRLYKGNIIKAGTTSPYSLYNESLASFTTGDLYDHHDADGFITLFGLPLKVRAMRMQELAKENQK